MMDRNLKRAQRLFEDEMANPDKYPDDFVAIPLDPALFPMIFTSQRIRLLRIIRDRGPFENVKALAKAARRDESRVSRDIDRLVGYGLVELKRNGKSRRVTAPFKPIILA